MKALFICLFVCAAVCNAQTVANALVDASGSVLELSTEALTPGTGSTLVTGLTPPTAALQSGGLRDDFGRSLWRVSAGVVVAQAPTWPVTAAQKLAASRRLRATIREVNGLIVEIKEWQADAANVAAWDRSAELTAAQTKLTQLRAAIP